MPKEIKPQLPDHATHWAVNRNTKQELPVCFIDGVMYYHNDIYTPLRELSCNDWYVKTDFFWHKLIIAICLFAIVAAYSFL